MIDNIKTLLDTDRYGQWGKQEQPQTYVFNTIEINVPYAKICRVVLRAIVSTAVEGEQVIIVMMLVVTSTGAGAIQNDVEYVNV